MSKVLLVGLSKKDAPKMAAIFKTVDVASDAVPTMEQALEKIPGDRPTVVVAQLPNQMESLASLNHVLKTSASATPFVVLMPDGRADVALDAMRMGAYDCLTKPYSRFDVLAAAKRAALKNGRTLFAPKLTLPQKRTPTVVAGLLVGFLSLALLNRQLAGPPPDYISLGSANLGGIQWEGRTLWMADWYDSTVTQYEAKRGLIKKSRGLISQQIFKMQDGQPILVCNTPETLVTIGTDLKMRSHQRSVGLPTMQTVPTPGLSPAGIAWAAGYLWSIDNQTGLLYKHGPDLRVLESMRCIVSQPIGLTALGSSLWIFGGSPFQAACLEMAGEKASVWKGPFRLSPIFTEGVLPSGVAAGHGRFWFVSGGDPQMISRPINDVVKDLYKWQRPVAKEPLKGAKN